MAGQIVPALTPIDADGGRVGKVFFWKENTGMQQATFRWTEEQLVQISGYGRTDGGLTAKGAA